MSTLSATFELTPEPGAPRHARRLLAELLTAWRFDAGRRDDVMVLVTEVISNAVDHAGGEDGGDVVLALDVTASDTWLRVALADGSTIRPIVREINRTAPRGRGMQLVAALADRWGSEDHQGGKRVWFELGAEPSAASSPTPDA
jgi:two-component sensor histidine kinase